MSTRQERGQAIAETQKIIQKGGVWLVPSQSDSGKKYTVSPDEKSPHCSCPDHEAGFICKHLFAVRVIVSRTTQEVTVGGTVKTTTETITVETTAKRKTYAQDWPKYNAAQVNEREHFHDLLAELCSMLPETPRKPGRGRKPVSYRDGLFSAILKVFSLTSGRRFSGELKEAHERGYIEKLPSFNYPMHILDQKEVTPLLKGMIETSALPLTAVETKFAIDSTGFATTKYASWFDKKYNQMKEEQVWVKAHFCTGVRSNIVTAVDILDQNAADSPQLPGLTHKTAENFKIGEMTGDKAYAASANFEAVESHGGKFFPMFKKNTTGAVGGSFEKAFHYFCFKTEEYLEHYHQRSNVETTVSMVKRKFGDMVKAKNDTAQKNEVYAKFVCHNLCVLIQEMYVMGIDPTFRKPDRVEKPRILNLLA